MFLQSPILSYNYRFSVSEHDEHPPDWLQILTCLIIALARLLKNCPFIMDLKRTSANVYYPNL